MLIKKRFSERFSENYISTINNQRFNIKKKKKIAYIVNSTSFRSS